MKLHLTSSNIQIFDEFGVMLNKSHMEVSIDNDVDSMTQDVRSNILTFFAIDIEPEEAKTLTVVVVPKILWKLAC